MKSLKLAAGYVKARLSERSTWLLIIAGISGAAALAWPWSIFACVAGVIAALVPDNAPKA